MKFTAETQRTQSDSLEDRKGAAYRSSPSVVESRSLRPLRLCGEFLLVVLLCAPLIAAASIVDRIVASMGTQAVTLSEVQEAQRLERFFNRQPLEPLTAARIRTVADRLMDQLLLQQEIEASRIGGVPPEAVEQRLAELKRAYGGEAQFASALAEYRLSEAAVRRQVELQLNVLRFLDVRFRPMVTVEESDIERYYRETLVPRLRAQGASQPPPLAEVHDQIEAVITQERINQMYTRWLEDLRSQANIQYR